MITKIVIRWSEEDNCYGGHANGDDGKTFISFEGNTIAEAMADCINGIMDIYELKAEVVDNVPTADVEPIRHGQWEKQDDLGSTEWQLCPICNRITKIDTVFDRVFEYCPHCGAKMGEVKEER